LDALNPSCYDKGSDIVDKWDVIGSNEDPIYDMEGHFQMFPLQLSYEVTNDSDIWQQGNGIVTDISKDDLVLFFGHTLKILMSIPLSAWIYFMKKTINHRCAQILIEVRTLLAQSRVLVTRFFSSLRLLYIAMSLRV
jgi:hypothetical protein